LLRPHFVAKRWVLFSVFQENVGIAT
jgi:hypothetical protein